MSFNLEGAFNQAVKIQARDMTYYQVSSNTEITIPVAPSNYFRNHALLEETISEGREYVISKITFDSTAFTGQPVRGDRIISSDLGNFTIREVREMLVLGTIVGYRVRCD